MKFAIAANALSKRIVPSNDHYKALRAIAASTENINRPAILFIAEPSKLDVTLCVIIQVPMDSTLPEDEWNSSNTVKQQYALLPVDGTAEDFCRTYHNVDRVIASQGHEHSMEHFIGMFKLMCTPELRERLEQIEGEEEVENQLRPVADQLDADALIRSTINEFAKDFFHDVPNCWSKQKRCLHKQVLLPGMKIRDFVLRVRTIAKYMANFPYEVVNHPNGHVALEDDEILTIIDSAVKPHWRLQMIKDEKTIDSFATSSAAQSYFSRLEETDALEGREDEDSPVKEKSTNGRKRKRVNSNQSASKENTKDAKKPRAKCKHCGKVGHPESKCWNLDANKDSRPKNWDPNRKQGESPDSLEGKLSSTSCANKRVKMHHNITNPVKPTPMVKTHTEQDKAINSRKRTREALIEEAQPVAAAASISEEEVSSPILCPMKALLSKNNHSDSSDNDQSSDEFEGYLKKTLGLTDSQVSFQETVMPFFNRDHLHKKAKVGHYTAEMIIEILDRNGKLVPIRGLLDTGTTSSILLREFVKKGRASGYSGHPTTWKTMGGQFTTKKKGLVDFKFPELNTDKKVTWVCHIDETTQKEHALYDMIIGMDLMTAIGIYVDTEEKVIRWQGNVTPLGQRNMDQETVNAIYALTQDSPVVQQAEQRQQKILDADYSAVDIDNYVNGLPELTTVEKEQLKHMLKRHPKLFQGGLGVLNVPPVHLDLKPDAKPYHSHAFPIPQSVRATTKKEIDRLEAIGVLKKQYDSEWAAPMFVQKKKTGDVRVLVDFRRLNDCILRKPFPLPKIADLLQTLTGFTYATAIDLSMGYYHIPMDETSQKLCSMVLPWAK